ncbi:26S proteasome non-ATPase regulatory subunit 10-like [Anopheles ziemanni]|uniref:26S proteasome non-ATPase regulatory subunit 10-like n=1 Tax=Anopheles coustani TaxID=139045 RepID=UPI00265A8994|nr:26S proteasome non-ATPase regulatory subunit 10-like [Anopheles coustani]XP_058176133.1 26S proteasome non-ATPase regulatory subunit 10-like [Anopheles ziemanni]
MTSKTMEIYEFVRKRQEEIDYILTENSNIISQKDENDRFVLHWAALAGKEELCKYILQRFPEQRDAEDDTNATPLVLASVGGFLPTTVLMVKAGADINHRNRGGHSALQYACSKGRLDIANYLLNEGADVNIVDKIGDTPLHRATSLGHNHIVDTLLLHGANPNKANKEGNTPLHLACEENEQTCAILLLKRGANRTLLNAYEKTPLDLATRSLLNLIASEVDSRHAG